MVRPFKSIIVTCLVWLHLCNAFAQQADLKLLEAVNLGVTPKVRKSVVMVSRIGTAEVTSGVVVSEKGYILATRIPPVDSLESAYLLVNKDGSRIKLEQVSENEDRALVMLKLPSMLPSLKATSVSAGESDYGFWFILPTLPTLPLVDEPTILKWQSLKPDEDEDEENPEVKEVFTLATGSLQRGQLVLDVNGRLVGVVSRGREDTSTVITVVRLVKEWREFAKNISKPPTTVVLKLPEKKLSELVESSVPSQVPYGLVSNVGQSPTNSILGTVIDSNGLVVTKASELGASLNFRINGNTYPAALVATDEETDLALLAVGVKNLPVIKFTNKKPEAGQFVYTPRLLTLGLKDAPVIVGSYSHQRDFSAPNIHASSMVTTLGIVPEQSENRLVISAILPDSPAEQVDLKLGDQLLSINDREMTDRAGLARFFAERKAGETVTVKIRRQDSEFEKQVSVVGKFPKPPLTGIKLQRNYVPVVPSIRRAPFPPCLVHDLDLNAWECGGPLFDVDGQAIGINIASTGKFCSLALTPEVINQAIERMKNNVVAF